MNVLSTKLSINEKRKKVVSGFIWLKGNLLEVTKIVLLDQSITLYYETFSFLNFFSLFSCKSFEGKKAKGKFSVS